MYMHGTWNRRGAPFNLLHSTRNSGTSTPLHSAKLDNYQRIIENDMQ